MSDPLPYGRHAIDEQDIAAVVRVLRSDWLTTGPVVERFEQAVAETGGASQGVAVANGTAALHTAFHAAGVGPGDEVIVPAMTFAATANAVCFLGARPVFVDVEPDALLIDPAAAAAAITPRTKAIVGVDYAGHPCDWDALREVADGRGLRLVADACHALGGSYKERPVGSVADFSVFSFHPVKPITTGEGGMVLTDDAEAAARMRRFRNHGLTTDHRERQRTGAVVYDMVELGWNHRLSDLQCALGLSQLDRLRDWTLRRRALAARYRQRLPAGVAPLGDDPGHAYHLFVVQIDDRDRTLAHLRAAGIQANIHYKPVHLHTYYRRALGTSAGDCPVAEAAFQRILSLPVFPAMDEADVDRVVAALGAEG